SRRRHTRSKRDWSSDVCSSDLTILGAEFHDNCIPVDYSFNGIHVSGYCTRPLASKATRGYQNFFVNHRYVRSATCIHALEEAYKIGRASCRERREVRAEAGQ